MDHMEITCDFWGEGFTIARFTKVSRGRPRLRRRPPVPTVVSVRRQDSHHEHPHEQRSHEDSEYRDRCLDAVGLHASQISGAAQYMHAKASMRRWW